MMIVTSLVTVICVSAAKALEDQNALARSQIDLAQQALETQRRQHEQVMGALARLEQHLTGYSPALQPQQVCHRPRGLSTPERLSNAIGTCMYVGRIIHFAGLAVWSHGSSEVIPASCTSDLVGTPHDINPKQQIWNAVSLA